MEHFMQTLCLCASLSLLAIAEFSLAAASDTLSPDQTLSGAQVLASADQIFELGFFSPGNSTSKFLGIWYAATPDVVVWVANRQNPIAAAEGGGILALSNNGTLILTSSQRRVVWSTNSSIAASSTPVLRLLNTGNLVVVDNSAEIWKSFDYPGDSRFPGMNMVDDSAAGLDKHLTSWKGPNDPSMGEYVYRIENNGLPHASIFKGNLKIYRTGPWNGQNFTGLPFVADRAFEAQVAFKDDRLVSVSTPYNNSFYLRLTMNYAGLLDRYILNERGNEWIHVNSVPSDICDNYGLCGANSVCRSYETPAVCKCLNGFVPKSQKEWDLFLWRSGCTRIPPMDCWKEDGFKKFDGIKYPDTLSIRVEKSMIADDCREECLGNCNCSAYADPYLINKKDGCMMWFGDLVDIREFTGVVSLGPSVYIRVPKAEEDQMKYLSKKRGSKRLLLAATAASVGMLVLMLCLGGIICKIRRRRRVASRKEREDFELPLFALATIAAATNNFSDENLIGEGGFGPVYKGNLSPELEIAVKRMSRSSGQGSEEFKNEVILIAKLQHRNLVRILGCCIEGEEKMLVYEYMQNKSLDYFIFNQEKKGLLSWQTRFDIIMGIARGLLYLHHDSRLKVIHRDLKTSNILLDDKLNAKISDFGLARMFEGDQTMAKTKRVVGTYGYMAPEYAFHGNFSVKSDVYSLGVVILEVVSGKKNRGFEPPSLYQNLLEQAYVLWMENRELELMDECYKTSYVDSQVKKCIQIGLLCIQSEAKERPVMPSVIQMLSSEDTAALAQPQKPAFFLNTSLVSSEKEGSAGSMSITNLAGR